MSTKKVIHTYKPTRRKGASRYQLATRPGDSAAQSQLRAGDEVKNAPQGEQAGSTPKPRIQPGSMKGIVLYIADDFDAPLDDFAFPVAVNTKTHLIV